MNNRCLAKRLMALPLCLALVSAPGFFRAGATEFNSLPLGGGLPANSIGEQPEEEPAEENPEDESEAELILAEGGDDANGEPIDIEPAGEADPLPGEGQEALAMGRDIAAMLADETQAPEAALAEATADVETLDALYAAFANELGAVPLANIINERTIEVTDYDELAVAIRSANYTEIYFLNSIEATSRADVVVNSSKSAVTIYGRAYADENAETIYTLTQYYGGALVQTINVASGAAQTVTLRDMNVVGTNYYGIVGVTHATSYAGVTVRYQNVTYAGPQMAYNRYGTVEFIDCDITIQPGYNVAEEVAEAHNVVLGGTTTITSTSSANVNSMFWITEILPGNPSFTVLENADISINSTSYLFYADQGSASRPTLTFEPNCRFITEATNGVSRHYINYHIQQGAEVSFIQTRDTAQDLRIQNFFLMEADSRLTYIRTGGSAATPLLYTQNSGTNVTFNNPERVVLYNFNGYLVGGSPTTYTFNTQAMNMWRTGDDTGAEPTHIWNKAGGEVFNTTINFTNINSYSVTSEIDTTTDPVDSDITDNANFYLPGTTLMVFGQMLLDPNLITNATDAITGSADAGAAVSGSYTGENGTGALNGTAGDNGQFSLALSEGAPVVDTTVYLTSFYDSLRMRKQAPVENAADYTLAFLEVPATLPFVTGSIPLSPTLVERQDADWAILVGDNRPDSPGFSVQASISGPLAVQGSSSIPALENALVYVRDNAYVPLSATPLTIYRNSSGVADEYSISWAGTEGVLVYLVPGDIRAGVNYTTTIQWDLVDAP